MKQLSVVFGVMVLATALLLWGRAEPPGGGVDEPAAPSAPPNAPTNAAARAAPGVPPSHPNASPARSITVRGRCVDAVDGMPLAECEVTLSARRSSGRDAGGGGTLHVVHTDGTGRFRAAIEVPPEHGIAVAARSRGRAGVAGFVGRPRKTALLDAGDIPMPPGAVVLAHVVDEAGQPVSGVSLGLHHTGLGEHPTFRATGTLRVRSDENGALAFDAPLACGAWRLSVPEHMELIEPAPHLEILENLPVQEATIVLRQPAPEALLTGMVVDEAGRPVSFVRVEARTADGQLNGAATADERGRFDVRGRGDLRAPVQLSIRRAPGFDDLLTPQRFAWGSRGIVLSLHHAADIVVTVVEAETARPVEDYQLTWFRADEDTGGTRYGFHAAAGHHERGMATVGGAPRGRIGLVVTPDSDLLAPNDPVEIVHPSGAAEVRVELERRTALPVRVAFADGRPVAGTVLELVRPEQGGAVELAQHGLAHPHYFQQRDRSPYALVLDTATTDDAGHATLRWPASGAALAIRVLGPGHLPVVVHGIAVRGASESVAITVSAGATLSGVVRPLTILHDLGLRLNDVPGQQGPAIVLTYAGEQALGGFPRRETRRLSRDGSFQLTGLQPGAWTVMFRAGGADARRVASPVTKRLPPVTLVAGRDSRVEYDVSDLGPAHLEGQVVLDGQPATSREVLLARMSESDGGALAHAGSVVVRTEPDGHFTAEGLPPGRYFVSVSATPSEDERLVCPEAVTLAAGDRATHVFHIHTGALEVRIANGTGEPVAEEPFVIHNEHNGFRTRCLSDAEGVVRVESIAAGRYTVSTGGRPLAPLGDVTVSPGPTRSRARFTVPPP